MTDEQVVEWRQKIRDLVAPHTNGEEVIAAAGFRRGGAAASMVASKAQLGGIVYAGRATLVGVGVKDDPISQEVIGVLQGTAQAS